MSEPSEPTEQKNVWYYRPPTQQVVGVEGPLTGVQLLQRAKEGKIGLTTLVRNPMATKNQWVPAERIPSLAAAINEAKAAGVENPARAIPAAPTVPEVPPAPAVSVPAVPSAPNPFSVQAAAEPIGDSNPFVPPVPDGRGLVDSTSKQRYPNLHRYMGALRILSLIGMIIIALAGLSFALMSLLFTLPRRGLFEGLVGVGMGVVIAAIGYLYYVIFLAGIELIQVVLDIEANTRGRRDR